MSWQSTLMNEWERLATDLATHLEWLERGELDDRTDDVLVLRQQIADFDTVIRKGAYDS
jgi:hypothetical protein